METWFRWVGGNFLRIITSFLNYLRTIPYDSLSSVHFQMDIGAPKWHLFDQQFCEGVLQIFCKQRLKGLGKIPKFWPLHSVRQNIAGFRRGLFVCFLGHAPLLQYYLLFGPHPLLQLWRSGVAQKAGNTVIRGCGPKSRKKNPPETRDVLLQTVQGSKF